MKIIKLKQYTSPNEWHYIYTLKQGDKYLLCKNGMVFFALQEERLEDFVTDSLEIPYCKEVILMVTENMNSKNIEIYDLNMNYLYRFDNMDDFLNNIESYTSKEYFSLTFDF